MQEAVYWLGMNKDLINFISNCDICASFQSVQPKELMMANLVPNQPWEKIGIGIFTYKSKDYLCIVDYYLDYFEVDQLSNKTGEGLIKKLKKHFATHGIPDVVQSDNGPPFSSKEFSSFAEKYEFKHTTSSPKHPQSNGKVENAVKTAKTLLKKTQESKTDYQLALLIWRNTPTEGLNSSPAQRLFGRRTRTLLPTSSKLLKPKLVPTVGRKQARKRRQENYFNRNTTKLPALKQGATLRVLLNPESKPTKWHKANVIQRVSQCSYMLITEDGGVFRRNRVHLRSTTEDFSWQKEQDTEIEYDTIPEVPTPTPPCEEEVETSTTSATTSPSKEPPPPGLRRS